MKMKNYLKFISLFVCMMFTATELTFAGTTYQIQIPENYGKVESRFKGKDERTVVLVRDAHNSKDAQHSISSILNYLSENYSLNQLNLEGASGELDFDFYRRYPNKEASHTVMDQMLEKSKISGAEHAAMVADKELSVYGVENAKEYQKNLDAYKETRKGRQETLLVLLSIEKDITGFCAKIFNADLARINEIARDYHKDQTNLVHFYQALLETSQRRGFEIDPAKYVSIQYFQESVVSGAIEKGDRQLDITRLLPEIEALSLDLQSFLAHTPIEKEMIHLEKSLGIMKKMVSLEALPADVAYYRQNPTDFSRKFIENTLTAAYRLTASEKQKDSVGYAMKTAVWKQSLQRLEKTLKEANRFYQLADHRSELLLQNTLERMAQGEQKQSVLVSGGFHSDEIEKALRDRDISYLVINPKITDLENKVPYDQLMMQTHSAYEEILTRAFSTLAAEATAAVDPAKRGTFFLGATATAGADALKLQTGVSSTEFTRLATELMKALEEAYRGVHRQGEFDANKVKLAGVSLKNGEYVFHFTVGETPVALVASESFQSILFDTKAPLLRNLEVEDIKGEIEAALASMQKNLVGSRPSTDESSDPTGQEYIITIQNVRSGPLYWRTLWFNFKATLESLVLAIGYRPTYPGEDSSKTFVAIVGVMGLAAASVSMAQTVATPVTPAVIAQRLAKQGRISEQAAAGMAQNIWHLLGTTKLQLISYEVRNLSDRDLALHLQGYDQDNKRIQIISLYRDGKFLGEKQFYGDIQVNAESGIIVVISFEGTTAKVTQLDPNQLEAGQLSQRQTATGNENALTLLERSGISQWKLEQSTGKSLKDLTALTFLKPLRDQNNWVMQLDFPEESLLAVVQNGNIVHVVQSKAGQMKIELTQDGRNVIVTKDEISETIIMNPDLSKAEAGREASYPASGILTFTDDAAFFSAIGGGIPGINLQQAAVQSILSGRAQAGLLRTRTVFPLSTPGTFAIVVEAITNSAPARPRDIVLLVNNNQIVGYYFFNTPQDNGLTPSAYGFSPDRGALVFTLNGQPVTLSPLAPPPSSSDIPAQIVPLLPGTTRQGTDINSLIQNSGVSRQDLDRVNFLSPMGIQFSQGTNYYISKLDNNTVALIASGQTGTTTVTNVAFFRVTATGAQLVSMFQVGKPTVSVEVVNGILRVVFTDGDARFFDANGRRVLMGTVVPQNSITFGDYNSLARALSSINVPVATVAGALNQIAGYSLIDQTSAPLGHVMPLIPQNGIYAVRVVTPATSSVPLSNRSEFVVVFRVTASGVTILGAQGFFEGITEYRITPAGLVILYPSAANSSQQVSTTISFTPPTAGLNFTNWESFDVTQFDRIFASKGVNPNDVRAKLTELLVTFNATKPSYVRTLDATGNTLAFFIEANTAAQPFILMQVVLIVKTDTAGRRVITEARTFATTADPIVAIEVEVSTGFVRVVLQSGRIQVFGTVNAPTPSASSPHVNVVGAVPLLPGQAVLSQLSSYRINTDVVQRAFNMVLNGNALFPNAHIAGNLIPLLGAARDTYAVQLVFQPTASSERWVGGIVVVQVDPVTLETSYIASAAYSANDPRGVLTAITVDQNGVVVAFQGGAIDTIRALPVRFSPNIAITPIRFNQLDLSQQFLSRGINLPVVAGAINSLYGDRAVFPEGVLSGYFGQLDPRTHLIYVRTPGAVVPGTNVRQEEAALVVVRLDENGAISVIAAVSFSSNRQGVPQLVDFSDNAIFVTTSAGQRISVSEVPRLATPTVPADAIFATASNIRAVLEAAGLPWEVAFTAIDQLGGTSTTIFNAHVISLGNGRQALRVSTTLRNTPGNRSGEVVVIFSNKRFAEGKLYESGPSAYAVVNGNLSVATSAGQTEVLGTAVPAPSNVINDVTVIPNTSFRLTVPAGVIRNNAVTQNYVSQAVTQFLSGTGITAETILQSSVFAALNGGTISSFDLDDVLVSAPQGNNHVIVISGRQSRLGELAYPVSYILFFQGSRLVQAIQRDAVNQLLANDTNNGYVIVYRATGNTLFQINLDGSIQEYNVLHVTVPSVPAATGTVGQVTPIENSGRFDVVLQQTIGITNLTAVKNEYKRIHGLDPLYEARFESGSVVFLGTEPNGNKRYAVVGTTYAGYPNTTDFPGGGVQPVRTVVIVFNVAANGVAQVLRTAAFRSPHLRPVQPRVSPMLVSRTGAVVLGTLELQFTGTTGMAFVSSSEAGLRATFTVPDSHVILNTGTFEKDVAAFGINLEVVLNTFRTNHGKDIYPGEGLNFGFITPLGDGKFAISGQAYNPNSSNLSEWVVVVKVENDGITRVLATRAYAANGQARPSALNIGARNTLVVSLNNSQAETLGVEGSSFVFPENPIIGIAPEALAGELVKIGTTVEAVESRPLSRLVGTPAQYSIIPVDAASGLVAFVKRGVLAQTIDGTVISQMPTDATTILLLRQGVVVAERAFIASSAILQFSAYRDYYEPRQVPTAVADYRGELVLTFPNGDQDIMNSQGYWKGGSSEIQPANLAQGLNGSNIVLADLDRIRATLDQVGTPVRYYLAKLNANTEALVVVGDFQGKKRSAVLFKNGQTVAATMSEGDTVRVGVSNGVLRLFFADGTSSEVSMRLGQVGAQAVPILLLQPKQVRADSEATIDIPGYKTVRIATSKGEVLQDVTLIPGTDEIAVTYETGGQDIIYLEPIQPRETVIQKIIAAVKARFLGTPSVNQTALSQPSVFDLGSLPAPSVETARIDSTGSKLNLAQQRISQEDLDKYLPDYEKSLVGWLDVNVANPVKRMLGRFSVRGAVKTAATLVGVVLISSAIAYADQAMLLLGPAAKVTITALAVAPFAILEPLPADSDAHRAFIYHFPGLVAKEEGSVGYAAVSPDGQDMQGRIELLKIARQKYSEILKKKGGSFKLIIYVGDLDVSAAKAFLESQGLEFDAIMNDTMIPEDLNGVRELVERLHIGDPKHFIYKDRLANMAFISQNSQQTENSKAEQFGRSGISVVLYEGQKEGPIKVFQNAFEAILHTRNEPVTEFVTAISEEILGMLQEAASAAARLEQVGVAA